jgi:hypothetical protein
MNREFFVINPDGRDAARAFPEGAGSPGAAGHPPVNYHAYAACHSGAFLRRADDLPKSAKVALVLLRKRNLRAVLKTLLELRSRGVIALISLKESGSHQVADFLNDAGRSTLFRRVFAEAGGFLSSTPELVSLYRSAGARAGFFAPTPYPIDENGWDFSRPLAERSGIFVGTREFRVPSRNHWRAVAMAVSLAERYGCPLTVVNEEGWHGRKLIKGFVRPGLDLRILEGRIPYPEYLRVMARHRLVLQLDGSAVPGQVAGDALLCRMACLGGNGAVDRIAFGNPPEDPSALMELASRLLTEDAFWTDRVTSALGRAREGLGFSAVRTLIEREIKALQATA